MARDQEFEGEEESVYGDEGREELMEADEISAAEEGFSAGYDSTDREEEDSSNDAYEQAFAGREKPKKRASRRVDDEDEPDDE